MSFISLTFLIFLALTVLIYFIVPAAHRWLVLLTASPLEARSVSPVNSTGTSV